MANIAIIIAAGSGQRMGQDIPKQFINVYDNHTASKKIHTHLLLHICQIFASIFL